MKATRPDQKSHVSGDRFLYIERSMYGYDSMQMATSVCDDIL